MQRQNRRGSRGRYSTAGAVYDEAEELYIARDAAGSARDNLRDNAFATRRVVSPEPLLNQPVQRTVPAVRQQMGPIDVFLREVSRDRLSAILCAILFCLFLFLGFMYMHKRAEMREDLSAIEMYRERESYYLNENAKMERDLAKAKSAERIRNQAQNNLGMLRREKAQVQELYIQMPEESNMPDEDLAEEEAEFGLLDALLNLIGFMNN